MNSDAIFTIGKTHKVCQDYALAGFADGLPYTIVSDGCSSSRDTDFGGRILCKYAAQMLHSAIEYGVVPENAFKMSSSLVNDWKVVDQDCLDATLLIAKVIEDKVQVLMSGDGVVAAKRKDGMIIVKVIEFKDNAPLYLSYKNDPGRKKLLYDTYDMTKTIKTYFLGKGLPPVSEISTNEIENFVFRLEEFSHVSIMTDGALSFQRLVDNATSKTYEGMKLEEIIPDLMAYKGDAGEFVHRRTQKFFKQCTDNFVHFTDDFSMGTIAL